LKLKEAEQMQIEGELKIRSHQEKISHILSEN